jgi:hypothetical protein
LLWPSFSQEVGVAQRKCGVFVHFFFGTSLLHFKGSNNAYVMTNSKRVMYNTSVKVQKNFINGLFASLAYTI